MGWLDGNGGWAPSCPTARGRLSVAAADGHVSHRGPNQTSTWLRVVGILCAVNRPRTTLSPPPPPLHDWGVLESRKCGQAGSPPATEAKILPRRKELDAVCVVYAVAVYADTPLREFHSTRNINFHVAKCAINRRSLF